MSRSFDYQSSSVEAIAERFFNITNQAYSRLVTYYSNKQDHAMVSKLVQARKLSTIQKLQSAYSAEYLH